jgi:hypothetical protein
VQEVGEAILQRVDDEPPLFPRASEVVHALEQEAGLERRVELPIGLERVGVGGIAALRSRVGGNAGRVVVLSRSGSHGLNERVFSPFRH